jgi:hypothetical protein
MGPVKGVCWIRGPWHDKEQRDGARLSAHETFMMILMHGSALGGSAPCACVDVWGVGCTRVQRVACDTRFLATRAVYGRARPARGQELHL